MALTTGTQASSGTPATDFYNTIATVMTNAGWTHLGQKTAALMGTTGVVEVWYTAATTVASNVYTGTIVYIEVDNTNARLRIFCSEMFDNGAAGSPATNVKWAAPGSASGNTQTPTATYHYTDAYQALAQTAPNGATVGSTVGWGQVLCSGAGFSYWLGADSTRLLVATSGAVQSWVVAGALDYLGSSGGSGAVFLAGRGAGASGAMSWIGAGASGNRGNVRCSRDPLNTTSLTGNFCFTTGPSWPRDVATQDQTIPTGAIGASHQWHTVLVSSPCFIHGIAWDAGQSFIFHKANKSHLARMSDFIVFGGGTEPTLGDTLTISGVTYVILGLADNYENVGAGWINIAVRQAAF